MKPLHWICTIIVAIQVYTFAQDIAVAYVRNRTG